VVVAVDHSDAELRMGGSAYLGGADHGRTFNGEESVSVRVLEAHGQYREGGFEARALFASVHVEGAGAVSRELSDSTSTVLVPKRQDGWYVEGAYDVAPWVGIPAPAQLLAWVRYEDWEVKEDDAGPQFAPSTEGGSAVTVGLELKPHPSVAVKADLTLQDRDAGGETPDPLRLGVGFVF
jgi:hypothetical protein